MANKEKVHPGIASYPRRIVTLRTIDCGPMEDGGGNCPHCGAEGRWIHIFLCEDGTTRGAMSGCIKLFGVAPRTRLTVMADALVGKLKASRGPVRLASWFQKVKEVLEQLEKGEVTLGEARDVCSEQYNRRENWLIDNGYRNRRR